MSPTRAVPAVLLAVALLVSGCTSTDGPTAPTATSSRSASSAPPAADGPAYVALGDSFTAGPGIEPVDPDSGLCIRSEKNYPSLVASQVRASSFTDVSCSGATTSDVVEGGFNPPQLEAVSDRTGLVTLGIGGNDSGLFAALSRACTSDVASCSAYLQNTLPSVLASTSGRVVSALEAVKGRAPRAQVLLVGYLRIAPGSGTCSTLGGAAFDAAGVAAGERALDTMLADAARSADVTYVSMSRASDGHDACAGADAWTNGLRPAADDGITLHPRAAGMRAVASAVEKALTG
ncbi:hypothetical protein ASD11_08185 [Aeromicrobium sp. Root495]|uniref:SGNH/GDSL hydrolase family protein n=1 Tax=Aeromicrobium sp. Root495 TaxID=1736550 RepID=UPI0006F3E7D1|nr:SGNH/GDSL hydrolase family protein [Aeromicrobium sp. Root495]KQY59528.1 hypothetical protein ASD11_08185 [Aeromicrobium sp. Root495]